MVSALHALQTPPCHWWQGASGYWYVHWIYKIDAIPEYLHRCNYVLVRRQWDGKAEPVYIGQTGDGENRLTLSRHEKFHAALRLGAIEIHVHLLAQSRQHRFDIESDLRRGHATLLNKQPTPAQAMTGFGLGALSGFGMTPLESLALAAAPATAGFDMQPYGEGGVLSGGISALWLLK